jgi:hypothetical protein
VSDRYLWDRSGPPDPEVERLERLLERFRGSPPMPAWPAEDVAVQRKRPSFTYLAAAAALFCCCALGLWPILHAPRPSWAVARVAGVPAVDAEPFVDTSRFVVGQWLETDRDSRATVRVGEIGVLQVEPHTRLRLLDTAAGNHRLALARGTVHALIWAPPGEFFVETPSSTAIDLGCAYTLRVDPDGGGIIDVTSGWVGFEHRGRESFIPAGAQCRTRVGVGPGTPYFADASAPFRQALTAVDFGDPRRRRLALDDVLAGARGRDAVTLWHLLSRVDEPDRGRAFEALARFAPPPPSVTRAGIVRGDRKMIDAWWNALGLGTTSWWRTWKRQWR